MHGILYMYTIIYNNIYIYVYTYMYVHACGCVSSYDIVGLHKIWSYHVHIPVASLAQGGLDMVHLLHHLSTCRLNSPSHVKMPQVLPAAALWRRRRSRGLCITGWDPEECHDHSSIPTQGGPGCWMTLPDFAGSVWGGLTTWQSEKTIHSINLMSSGSLSAK